MKRAINTTHITRVTFNPEVKCYYQLTPSHNIETGWIFKNTIHIPEGVESYGGSVPTKEFIENNPNLFVRDGIIYKKCNVTITSLGEGLDTRYFDTEEEGLKFYNEVIQGIGFKVTYKD